MPEAAWSGEIGLSNLPARGIGLTGGPALTPSAGLGLGSVVIANIERRLFRLLGGMNR